jgi:hypothetical protein
MSDSEEARAGSAILRGTLGGTGADVVLTVPRGRILSHEVSPDGRWIAYTSDESGTPQVYVQAFPAGDRKLQVTSDGAYFMFWARSGRSLFVSKADERSAGMWETRLDLTAGRVLEQSLASELDLWDGIMPDDSLFVGATPRVMPGERPRFVLVQGILGEIRRLLDGQ